MGGDYLKFTMIHQIRFSRSIHKSTISIHMFRSKFSQSRAPHTLHQIEAAMSTCNRMHVA